MREELMYGCLRTIENDDLRILAGEMIKTIPEYWYHVGASSTGKYHPEYSLGEGGLMRHTVALVRRVCEIKSVNRHSMISDGAVSS